MRQRFWGVHCTLVLSPSAPLRAFPGEIVVAHFHSVCVLPFVSLRIPTTDAKVTHIYQGLIVSWHSICFDLAWLSRGEFFQLQ